MKKLATGKVKASEMPALGACCRCRTLVDVYNIIMLPHPAAIPGHGWGCVVCHQPPDGASLVVCGRCMKLWIKRQRGRPEDEPANLIEFFPDACRGFPGTEGREPLRETIARGDFEHDLNKHPERVEQ